MPEETDDLPGEAAPLSPHIPEGSVSNLQLAHGKGKLGARAPVSGLPQVPGRSESPVTALGPGGRGEVSWPGHPGLSYDFSSHLGLQPGLLACCHLYGTRRRALKLQHPWAWALCMFPFAATMYLRPHQHCQRRPGVLLTLCPPAPPGHMERPGLLLAAS